MWVDASGVAHTVALPDPSVLMERAFRDSLSALLDRVPEELWEVLDECETQVYVAMADTRWSPEIEAQFEGVPPPANLLDGLVLAPSDIRLALDRMDRRWRLDAISAIGDYLAD